MGLIRDTVDRYVAITLRDMGYSKANVPAVMRPVFAGESRQQRGGELMDDMTSAVKSRYEKAALAMSWIYSNVDTISKQCASSELYVVGSPLARERRPLSGHDFARLFVRPNDFMSGSFLMRYTVSWLLLRGEAYWMLVPDQTGRLSEIWPLPSDRISPIPDKRKYIKGYRYSSGGVDSESVVIPTENILYLRDPNPFDYHRGLSKLEAARNALETDAAAIRWNKETFTNEATLRTLISVPQETPRNIFDQIKEELETQLLERRRRYVISRGGDINAKSIGLSVKDMEYLQGREFSREEIDRIFSIPGGFWSKAANRANSENARKVVAEQAVWPNLMMIAEEITAQVFPVYYPGEDIEARFQDIRPDDREMALKETQLKYQALSIDEVREIQGREQFGGVYGALPWPLRDKKESLAIFMADIGEEALLADAGADDTAPEPALEENGPTGDLNTGKEEDGLTGENRGIEPEQTGGDVAKSAAQQTELRALRNYCKKRIKSGGELSFEPTFLSKAEVNAALDFAEISRETMSTTDAVHAVTHYFEHEHKAAPVPFGNEDIDSIIQNYYEELLALAQSTAANQTSENDARGRIAEATIAAITLALLRGGGIRDNAALNPVEQEQLDALRLVINSSASRLAGEWSDSEDADPDSVFNRGSVWAATISGMFWWAMKGRADSDVQMVWRRGNTVEPCATCLWLDGQVKTAAQWAELPYYPQARNGSLECGGWNCDCRFEEV